MVLAALCAAMLSRCGEPEGASITEVGPATELEAQVLEITDGDTIVARLAASGEVERVRYIGVDTPESTPGQPLECFGHEAAAANRRLVEGRKVLLRPGVEPRDDYGRLLAWVRVGPISVNARLLRHGFARTLAIAPNDSHAARYERLEAAAGRAGVGLWRACDR
ncbi:MAG: thermonuclease family protein [Actinomycetota bacterium]|nr:thermonuclease family protein [Actinomycetota bacterium]